jgi:hypothetical protein
MSETFLSKDEVNQLLGLVRQRSILNNIVSMRWDNFYKDHDILTWMADKEHFQVLIDTVRVFFPSIKYF